MKIDRLKVARKIAATIRLEYDERFDAVNAQVKASNYLAFESQRRVIALEAEFVKLGGKAQPA
ncbi:MAG: hypothetical protein WDN46_12580 [Methylocella sp.]